MYITLTSFDRYSGTEEIFTGMRLVLKKDLKNHYDDEAIKVFTERGVPKAFVANSVHTVARGTHSAGYIYNLFDESCLCVVRFVTGDSAIAEMVEDVIRFR